MSEYTKHDMYILGQVFGLLARLAKPNGISTSEMTNAEIFPYKGFTMMYTLASHGKKITPKADRTISELLDQLDLDNMTELFNTPSPMETRMDWHVGYQESINLIKDSKLKEKRRQAGISQEDLAKKIGCTQKDISRWETGIVSPTLKNIVLLADALGCKTDEII